MKKIVLSVLILFSFTISAQEEALPQGWTNEGLAQLLFNQSAFNEEWTGGGTSSVAGNLLIDYQEHYRAGDFTLDNRFLATYGLTKLKGDEFMRKTSDRLELNTIAGLQVQDSNWYYSFFGNFRTQFTKGYEYSEDPDTGRIIRTETTRFFSPAYLQFGPGMMWKKNENLWFNVAPATARFIFVSSDFTSGPDYIDGSYYGVEQGETSRFEFGASFSGYVQFEVMENVSMENSLSLYSNYLDEPGNIDIDYLASLTMGINRYLSANLIFQAIYDDNIVEAFQIREVFGAGFNYSF